MAVLKAVIGVVVVVVAIAASNECSYQRCIINIRGEGIAIDINTAVNANDTPATNLEQ